MKWCPYEDFTFAMVSYIARWMVSEWIDRQEYCILKVFSLIGYCLISHSIARQDFDGGLEQPNANWAKDGGDGRSRLEVSRRLMEKGITEHSCSRGS